MSSPCDVFRYKESKSSMGICLSSLERSVKIGLSSLFPSCIQGRVFFVLFPLALEVL